jgi:carbon-monoxide dehydrogenase medium subunit
LSVTGVAVSVTVEEETLQDARIVLGSAAPTVMRARNAEDFLRGKKISDELLAEAGVMAAAESRPRDSIRGSAEYRRNLVEVLTKRALRKAIDEGHV